MWPHFAAFTMFTKHMCNYDRIGVLLSRTMPVITVMVILVVHDQKIVLFIIIHVPIGFRKVVAKD